MIHRKLPGKSCYSQKRREQKSDNENFEDKEEDDVDLKEDKFEEVDKAMEEEEVEEKIIPCTPP